MEKRWFVRTFESERGWGQSTISVCEYDTKELAEARVHEVNDQLPNVFPAPDYYIMAELSSDLNNLYSKEYMDCRTKKGE